jgi:hypothetical protein
MWARSLPAALLAVVALVQVTLTHTTDLTPWKGGGFGMFSTLDHGAFRNVTIVVDGADRSETIETPPSLEVIAARAANCPADWLLRRLARGVVERERRYGRDVTRVRLQVRWISFDPVTLRATERPLRAFVYEVPRLAPAAVRGRI